MADGAMLEEIIREFKNIKINTESPNVKALSDLISSKGSHSESE